MAAAIPDGESPFNVTLWRDHETQMVMMPAWVKRRKMYMCQVVRQYFPTATTVAYGSDADISFNHAPTVFQNIYDTSHWGITKLHLREHVTETEDLVGVILEYCRCDLGMYWHEGLYRYKVHTAFPTNQDDSILLEDSE